MGCCDFGDDPCADQEALIADKDATIQKLEDLLYRVTAPTASALEANDRQAAIDEARELLGYDRMAGGRNRILFDGGPFHAHELANVFAPVVKMPGAQGQYRKVGRLENGKHLFKWEPNG